MSNKPKTVLRTEVPIIGETNNFRDAVQKLTQYINYIAQQLAQEIGMCNARLDSMEQASKSINIFINPDVAVPFLTELKTKIIPRDDFVEKEETVEEKPDTDESNQG
jgi:hypothetical protein